MRISPFDGDKKITSVSNVRHVGKHSMKTKFCLFLYDLLVFFVSGPYLLTAPPPSPHLTGSLSLLVRRLGPYFISATGGGAELEGEGGGGDGRRWVGAGEGGY